MRERRSGVKLPCARGIKAGGEAELSFYAIETEERRERE